MSTQHKHTPAYWAAIRIAGMEEDGRVLTFSEMARVIEEETHANELLGALRKAETWIATFSDQVGNPAGPLANDLAEIRAAIARATA